MKIFGPQWKPSPYMEWSLQILCFTFLNFWLTSGKKTQINCCPWIIQQVHPILCFLNGARPLGPKGWMEDKLLQVFFLEQPSVAMGSAKDGIFKLRGFAGKRILSEYCENGQKNTEDGCNKLILGEMCSMRAAGWSHPPLLMFPCHHINLVLHQPWLLFLSGSINWPQKSSAATYSHIRAAGGMLLLSLQIKQGVHAIAV